MKVEEVLAGYVPGPRARDGLALALLLRRQARARLTVANVRPPAWTTPGPARAEDAAWRAYLAEQADAALAEARGLAGEEAEYVVHTARHSGRGLVELARRRAADVVVIGSAPGGARGRIAVGSTADQLLHASSVPVLLAPRGFGDGPPPAFDRLTVAYRRGPGCDAAVKDAARAAVALELPLRLVTLVVSPGRRARAEEEMLVRLREQAATDLRAAARGQARRLRVEVEVLEGRTVAQALGAASWLPGEMIICASSDTGPLRRVFLGDTSLKIVRAATRPVMILTRRP
ncbi:universal stress protein [Actinomadura sp. ATCC 31491]|uniref:Universal stress protein n=1 Tax=Actinomadura luzonensis TaxID=2805427 RepID=A0ABT0G876_9ACTN|nr:universal stress protein [Actinomadura luzonensis]MCK2220790.1 universal stress protein [Actinomadura luzonensis]